jgi:hypothetical protein
VLRNDVVAVVPAFEAEGSIGAVVAIRRRLESAIVVDDGRRMVPLRPLRWPEPRSTDSRDRGKGAAPDVACSRWHARRRSSCSTPTASTIPTTSALLAAWDRSHPDLTVGAWPTPPASRPCATDELHRLARALLTGCELEDSQSGYRLLAAAGTRAGARLDGYAIESEMLIKAAGWARGSSSARAHHL